MKPSVSRRRLLQAGLASSFGLWAGSARACEFYTSTLRVTHPWARATLVDATSAVVCMKFDEVQQDDRLIGVETMLATGAEIGGQGASGGMNLLIPKGQTTLLSEGGSYLRLLDLQWQLQVARAYPLDLIFEKGGRLQATLTIDFARSAD